MVQRTDAYELKIIRGLPKVPNDTQSAEDGLRILDLTDPAGFSVDDGGYSPQRPTLKQGGVWADTALQSGRVLIASAETNVTETITCTLNSTALITMNMLLLQMEQMINDLNDFWTSTDQIEPVYIKNMVPGEPGPRYALLSSLEMSIDDPDNLQNPTRNITISIEREPYWRPIPPGANPKLWTFYVRDGSTRNFNTTSAPLLSGTDHLITQTIQNRREWQPGQTATFSTNYIDIPAESIPGDAPALISLGVSATVTGVGTPLLKAIHVANKITPTSLPIRTTGTRAGYNILNVGDNASLATFTLAVDSAYPIGNNQITGQRARIAGASGSITWSNGESVLDATVFRGTYAVFVRANISGNTITFGVNVSRDSSLAFIQQTVSSTGNTGTSSLQLYYIGRISIPPDTRVTMDVNGNGLMVTPSSATNLSLQLTVSRTAGADNTDVADIILIPVDREYGRYINQVNGVADTGPNILLDNTGYFDHGVSEPHAMAYTGASLTPAQNPEIQGNLPYLYPGYDNRLYFLLEQASRLCPIADTAVVRLNIVPRWTGLRDA